MKALLMKDYWIILRSCKQMLIVSLIFMVLSIASGELVWSLWPVFFISLMPYTITGYEEQSGWILYAETMPYGRKMIVYDKYVLMLINGAVMTVLLSAIAAVVLMIGNSFSFGALGQLSVIYAVGALLPGALTMPMVFKYGCTKGRAMYLILLAVFGGLMGAMGSISVDVSFMQILQSGEHLNLMPLLPIMLVLFALSAVLSVRLYEKRDL